MPKPRRSPAPLAQRLPQLRGRPSSYRPETGEAICLRLAEGESLNHICKDEGMPDMTTVMRWLKAHDDFRQSYAHAREVQATRWADEIVALSDAAMGNEDTQARRLQVDSRKWIVAKMLPKVYGDRTVTELTGKIDMTHQRKEDEHAFFDALRTSSDEDLEMLGAILEKVGVKVLPGE
jgi:hypothetical protein